MIEKTYHVHILLFTFIFKIEGNKLLLKMVWSNFYNEPNLYGDMSKRLSLSLLPYWNYEFKFYWNLMRTVFWSTVMGLKSFFQSTRYISKCEANKFSRDSLSLISGKSLERNWQIFAYTKPKSWCFICSHRNAPFALYRVETANPLYRVNPRCWSRRTSKQAFVKL